MKLIQTLTIAGQEYQVVEDQVVLVANGAGRAEFTIDSDYAEIKPYTQVSYDVGYTQHDDLSNLFLGFVETVNRIDKRRVTLFCREMAYVLAGPMPLNLRHPTLINVLNAIHDTLGINFSVPDKPYATVKMPHYANLGSGIHALEQAAIIFNIDDFFWQQQGEGVVYVGSHGDSRWAGREIDLPDDFFSDGYANAATISTIPSLRPGAILNGRRVQKIDVSNYRTVVTWQ